MYHRQEFLTSIEVSDQNEIEDRLWVLRRPAQFLADIVFLAAAFIVANLPAINVRLEEFYFDAALAQVSFVVLVEVTVLFLTGAYSIIWRYISVGDVRVFVTAALVSGSILTILRFALAFTPFTIWQVPLSVIFIQTVLGFGGLLGLRVLRRVFHESRENNKAAVRRRRSKRTPVILVGAGRTGATLAREVWGRADAELDIRGLVDDDMHKKGGSVSGHKVLGTLGDLPRLVDELAVREVVIALDNATGKEIRRVMDVCAELPVKTRIVPSLNEFAHGRVSVNRIRDVQIEDLLGREPVTLESDNLRAFLGGRTVMVTGAGGSIGSELVRQILNFRPEKVLLVERSEFFLFEISRELAALRHGVEYIPLIADAGDEKRMRQIFETHRPHVVFHAAAHKHVPLMEANAGEALKNNVFVTRLVGQLAGELGATDFVLISTDKAVNPTSLMGASKRLAELVVQSLGKVHATKYVAVRFGNVLGSAGSVVPIFREQIKNGGPVTVTDPEMKRYFMTIPEASQLVLQAGALGTGGEIFILDMGEPVKVLDLAEDMIRLSGLTPHEDIDIAFTGVRDGEKLFEELEVQGEKLEKTRHPKVFIGKIATYPSEDVSQMLWAFRNAVENDDEAMIRRLFNRYFPEASITEPAEPADERPERPHPHTTPRLGLAEK